MPRTSLLLTLLLLLPVLASAKAEEVLRIAVLKSGTVAWELDTIRYHGLDRQAGFVLELQEMAGGAAAKIAFQGGQADAIVADLLWAARQRAAGRDYVFIPFSKAVGALVVPQESAARSLRDIGGGTVGIAGGPIDKSWLILQAYAHRALGFDLAEATEQVYGAPPLIYKKAQQRELAASINYWHFTARLEAQGFRPLITVEAAAAALDLDPDVPLLGYVVRGTLVREQPQLVAGLAEASRAAKRRLMEDAAAWDRLRPAMRAESDAEFATLRAGFLAGVPAAGPVDPEAADRFLEVMGELGGEALLGQAKGLPNGLFYAPAD